MLSGARARSIARLPRGPAQRVLLAGVGTGLDFSLLPPEHRYVGLDFSRPMLAEASVCPHALDLALVEGDAQCLPFAAETFDAVLLHLIVAVVPHPERCLAEAARVLRAGGRAYVLDTFLRPGARARLRRALNPVARRIATRTDVVLEEALRAAPEFVAADDQPALAYGGFRLVELRKHAAPHRPP